MKFAFVTPKFIPGTPRTEFESLVGKRADLFFNARSGWVRFGIWDAAVLAVEDLPMQVLVLAGDQRHPLIMELGGCN